MFILSQAIIPVFAFAVLVNFYHFNPILSLQVGQNYSSCDECLASPCHTESKRPCTVSADNNTVDCFTCPEENGIKQFELETDCSGACESPNICVCDGKCYKCVKPEEQTDTSKDACEVPEFMWDDTCKNLVSYQSPVTPPPA